MNTGRVYVGASGTTTDAIIWGGDIPPGTTQTVTEAWNGTAWTEVADLATARKGFGTTNFGSTGKLAFSAGGTPPGVVATTEEWAFTGIAPDAPAAGYSDAIIGQMYYNTSSGNFKAIKEGGAPIGSWSSGGNLNQARYGNTGSGDGKTAITTGGYADSGTPAGYKGITEEYDGTSWTEVSDLNTARGFFGGTNSSPYTASLVFGGASPPAQAVTEEWDGSSWVEKSDLSTPRINNGGLGANAENALCIGGSNPGALDKVESWDGSSWSEVAEFSTNRAEMPVGAGTNTAAIIYGGQYPPGVTVTANTESWNGTSWTETADLNVAKGYHGGGGSQTVALAYGGRTSGSGQVATTESWDGTSWTEVADLATARYQAMGASTTTNSSAILTGGAIQSAPLSNLTEEWAAADFEIKTVTTS